MISPLLSVGMLHRACSRSTSAGYRVPSSSQRNTTLCCVCCVCPGDAVGAWFGDKLAAVLFPTADTQKQLKQLAERSPNTPELLLIANPQWELQVSTHRVLIPWICWGHTTAVTVAI